MAEKTSMLTSPKERLVLENWISNCIIVVGEPMKGFEELLERVRKLYEEKPYYL